MLQNVVALALPGVAPFELGVVCEVFGMDRSAQGLPKHDFAVISEDASPVLSAGGFDVVTSHGLERAAEADLVCVPAAPKDTPISMAVIEMLQETVARGSRVLSVCNGSFVLGAAGLLDGRPCTTHWFYAEELARRFPLAKVECDVLYVDDDPVFTSAGTAAGIDTCLHLLRKEYGSAAANGVARRMVVAPHRDGGQAQYVETPIPSSTGETLQPLLRWMLEHLGEEHTVDGLAARAMLSPRTFARRFRSETGTTPHLWLTQQRLLHAERLLEETDEPVERVASLSGFGSASLLRHHFTRKRGTTPQSYRRMFRMSA